uniref:non-specific serine/threonine protein kinase n=1 Tax=Romanomermis culicivorax TaxID=13658 RepID=A0A915KM48_ROMCU
MAQISTVKTDRRRQRAISYNSEQQKSFVNDQNPALQTDTLFEKRYLIVKQLKIGGFGQIYEALDLVSKNRVAIKVENMEEVTPGTFPSPMEWQVLKKYAQSPNCPKTYGFFVKTKHTFIVMQLLGPNLNELKRKCCLKPQRMSMSCSLKVLMQCLWAIEGLHGLGYLHRDIKPTNFVVGLGREFENRIYLIDFGLCRYFLDKNGQSRPERKSLGFRGTVRYASLNAHDEKDLSRRDDLLSLIYSFQELLFGTLPWHNLTDKAAVAVLKRKFPIETLCQEIRTPKGVTDFLASVKKLTFAGIPDYTAMVKSLTVALINTGEIAELDYDWQMASCYRRKHAPAEEVQAKLPNKIVIGSISKLVSASLSVAVKSTHIPMKKT